MAYFLPSYFQKRLLRYALARLDFIEADELDLDNLGITWGQRSAIELKDVGIQIKKLTSLLNIPPSILVTRARIGLLRLTIPADLYASGIVVEVGDIDIQVKLQDLGLLQSKDYTQLRPNSGLSKGNRADRPRTGSPAVHDPGGTRRRNSRHGTVDDTGIPSSEDLAISFLASESTDEQKELQSIVQSQSQYLHESTTTVGDDGVGAPAGFELPTFVASFFRDVADRLSVNIKGVSLAIEVDLPQLGTNVVDNIKIVLKVSEIELQGVIAFGDGLETSHGRRSITVKNVEVLLLGESDLFSHAPQSSANSSPRLSRAHTKMLSGSSKSMSATSSGPELSQSKAKHRRYVTATRISLSQQSSESSSNNTPAFTSDLGLGIADYTSDEQGDHEMDSSSLSFQSSMAGVEETLQSSPIYTHVNNRSKAESLARRGEPDAPLSRVDSQTEDTQNLAESRVFSHGEAESMYMSAVSHDMEKSRPSQPMPGTWDWDEQQDRPLVSSASFKPEDYVPMALSQQRTADNVKPKTPAKVEAPSSKMRISPRAVSSETSTGHECGYEAIKPVGSTSTGKRIMSITYMTISLSATDGARAANFSSSLQTEQQRSLYTRQSSPLDVSTYSQFPSQILAATYDLSADPAIHSRSNIFDHEAARVRQTAAPVIDVGTISTALDLPIGKLLVRAWQEIQPWVSSHVVDGGNAASNSDPSPFEAKVAKIYIKVCDEVPGISHEEQKVAPQTHAICNDEDLLLQISLSRSSFNFSFDGNSTIQRLEVNTLSVIYQNESVVSFADSINVRSSISANTLPMRNDLIVVTHSRDSLKRTEVQTRALKVKLDLLQIDDVLSRSGGLDSLLDLGNSIISTSTVRGESAGNKSAELRQRSVRFQPTSTFPQESESVDGAGPGKISVRIAGLLLELVGSESTMKVTSSTVKFVHRKDLAALRVDWIDIEGPLSTDQTRGDIKLRVTNTKLDYLNSPKETDLERLLSIIAPSSDKHEPDEDDDIMVDRLIRQRRKGAVLRLNLDNIETTIYGLQCQKHLTRLSDDLSRLSSVSKYLPEDNRPGILTLALVKVVNFSFVPSPNIGTLSLRVELAEAAHVSVPSLMAAHVTTLQLLRNNDCIIDDVVNSKDPKLAMSPPMLMIRYIADEMEPTVRMKVFNLLLEYKISTVAALVEFGNALHAANMESRPISPTSSVSSSSNAALLRSRNKTRLLLTIRDSALVLKPCNSSSKGVILLTDTTLSYTAGKNEVLEAGVDLKKLSMLICDDADHKDTAPKNANPKLFFDESLQVQELVGAGFVPIAFLSAASVAVKVVADKSSKDSTTSIELNNGLLILETCADSTQTMMQVLSGLTPPAMPSKVEKYRTEIVPIQDMLASFTGDAYFTDASPDAGLQAMPGIDEAVEEDLAEKEPEYLEDAEEPEDDDPDPDFMGQLWQSQSEVEGDGMSESYLDSELAHSTASAALSLPPVAYTEDVMVASREDIMVHSMLNFQEDHFSRREAVGGTAHRWDSKQNTYGLGSDALIRKSPLKFKMREFHVIWHLFDGYDWQFTRDSISKAVQDIETKAASRRPRSSSRVSPRPEEEDESEIGDFLFNSIYIGVPANRDPRELTNAINREIDDMTSDTGSYATTTTVTASPTRRASGPRLRKKKLRLERGKHHKMAFELRGVSADFIMFPPGSGEVESSIDVRVKDLEIIDQLPTSTWKKFATYMHDAGEREVNTNIVHIEILNVKPVAELAASEIVLKLTVLPLRLHVDQDAIDFMSRFFEFKDDRVPVSSTPSTPPFLQRVEVNPIRLKLDFKPKRVDYAGLRSGRTTEFMNFFVLDRADMVLRRVILYGVSGFDRVGIMLNNIWSPDVRRNQLPGVLAGLAPIRSLVNVGSGVRDLVVVPMREYKKDGRIVRSIQKGALAFAKTTTTELVNLGAKLAIGTQTVLQDTEKLLGQANELERWEDQGEDEEKKQISLYADQPLGIVQGLRGAYASLERDLLLARDAIVAVPGEVMATESATGAAQAVLRSAPTIILRPAIGASKAVGQTLLGAGNTLDRENYRRMQEKYKRH